MNTPQEFVDGFMKVVKYFNIDKKDICSKACMLAQSVALRSTSSQSFGVVDFSILTQYDDRLGYILRRKDSSLQLESNQTEVMRFLLDLLYVCLHSTDKNLKGITTAHSKQVVKPVVLSSSALYCTQDLDMTACYMLMEKYLKLVVSEDESEFDDLFNFVSNSLGKLKILLDEVDKNHVGLPLSYFNDLYLPEEYDSHGYEVDNKFPHVLKNYSKDSLPNALEYYELAKLMDLFILFLAGTGSESIDRVAFTQKMLKFKGMTDLVPVGIGGSIGGRGGIFRPAKLLTNSSLNDTYNSIFSQSIVLSRGSIDSMFAICNRLYNLEVD